MESQHDERELPEFARRFRAALASSHRSADDPRPHNSETLAAAVHERGHKLSPSAIRHWSIGFNAEPRASTLVVVAAVLDVPIEYFYPESRSRLYRLTMLASGISPENLEHVEGILEQLRRIEGLPPVEDETP